MRRTGCRSPDAGKIKKQQAYTARGCTHHDVVLLGGICNLHTPRATNGVMRHIAIAANLV